MFPILDRGAFEEVKSILDIYFRDNISAMELHQNGAWENVERDKKDGDFDAQAELYKIYRKRDEARPQNIEKQFEVRRK